MVMPMSCNGMIQVYDEDDISIHILVHLSDDCEKSGLKLSYLTILQHYGSTHYTGIKN